MSENSLRTHILKVIIMFKFQTKDTIDSFVSIGSYTFWSHTSLWEPDKDYGFPPPPQKKKELTDTNILNFYNLVDLS